MTLEELKLIRSYLNDSNINIDRFFELKHKSLAIIEREIKLRTTDYVRGTRTEGEQE